MRSDTFTYKADDTRPIFVYRWLPDEGTSPKAVVHIAHGMAEHAGRYARLAEALTAAGYAVYANDHRGHGKTARNDDELGWFAGSNGFRRVVDDLVELIVLEKGQNPGLPVVLLGHSMGSFLTQAFLIDHGHAIQAAVLSGTAGKPPPLALAGKLVARAEKLRQGPRGKSQLINGLTFDGYNKPFAPNRTKFDWLSRDEAEVDKYVADPRCGFVCTNALWIDLLAGLSDIARPERQANVPKEIPIYVFAGSEDPVGERTKSIDQLLGAYARAGLRNVTHRYYAGARHETLNETNRDEVTRDLVAWLDGNVKR